MPDNQNSSREASKVLADAKKILTYEPETGLFRRARDWKGKKAGEVTGPTNGGGYVNIKVKATTYKGHRLAWLFVHGRWPVASLDHINGDRADNRIANLRECSIRENGQNRKEHRDGRLVGASFVKKTGKWVSQINISGKRISLGHFTTQREAHEAYMAAASKAEDAVLYWQIKNQEMQREQAQ